MGLRFGVSESKVKVDFISKVEYADFYSFVPLLLVVALDKRIYASSFIVSNKRKEEEEEERRKMSLRKPAKEDVSAWSKILAYPASSPLVHVDRADFDFKSMSIGMYSGKRPVAQRATEPGSDTEKDEEGGANGSNGANDDPIEQARKFGRKKRMDEEEERWKRARDVEAERKRIVNKYYKQGKRSITDQEEQWFNSSGFDKNLDDAVSKAVLSKYNRDVLSIMARLPPANMGDLVPLKYWQMSKMGITILETTAQMCDAIVAEFQRQGRHPIRDAVNYTGSMKRDITFDFSSVLPAAMAVPRVTIPSATVQIHARTTPSQANAQLNSKFPLSDAFKPTSAIKWSVLFNPDQTEDGRIREVVNYALIQSGRADTNSDSVQIQIETQNGLNAALNGMWTDLLQYPYEPYAHAWNFQVPPMVPVTFGPSPVRNVAPPAPRTAPRPAQEGYRTWYDPSRPRNPRCTRAQMSTSPYSD